jgi:hypothetical protein
MLSRRQVAENPAWSSYILDPSTPYVYPKAVSTTGPLGGTVTNPGGLTQADGSPTCITSLGPEEPYLTLDFGKNLGGLVSLKVDQTDGTPIKLAYAESLRYMSASGDMLPDSAIGDPGRASIINARAPGTYVDTDGMTGAERWIRLSLVGPGRVCVSDLRVQITYYRPGPGAYDGHFLSSDPLINRIWYGAAYTLHMVTFDQGAGHMVVVDGAKRDREVWFGDLSAELPVGFYTTAAASMQFMRDTLTLIRCEQSSDGYIASGGGGGSNCPTNMPPPAQPTSCPAAAEAGSIPLYDALDVINVWQYVLYSGDTAFVRKVMPNLRAALGWMNCWVSGGLFVTQPDQLDWHVFDLAKGADANTNAVYYLALRTMANLELRFGQGPAAARKWNTRADAVRAAMLAKLWDPTAGAFRLNTDDPNDNHPQDGNVMAVLAGVITGKQALQALQFVHDHLWSTYGTLAGQLTDDPWMSQIISPYMSSYEVLARFGLGQGEEAMTLIRREFGHMVNTDPASTMWEKMGVDGNMPTQLPNGLGYGVLPPQALIGPGEGSMAHGWSTGVARALSEYVLGLQATGDGWSTWRVAPQPVDLAWAQGQVGTPHGPLISRWQRGPSNRWLKLTVVAPPHTSGTVVIPELGEPRALFRNGMMIRAVALAGAVDVPASSGMRTYAWWGPATSKPGSAR